MKSYSKKAPRKLTEEERETLNNCFCLPGWQFDEVIKPNCIQIDYYYVGRGLYGDAMDWAYLYGLQGQRKETKEIGRAHV
jgi:hypothetical protein